MGRDVNIKYSIANVIYRAALPLKLFRSFFPSPFKFQFITIFIILLDHQVPWNFYLQQQDNIEIHLKINRFSKYHFFPFHLFHFPFHTKQVYPLVQLYLSSPPRLRLVSTQDASPLPFNTDTSFTVAISTGCFQFTLDVAKLWWSFIDSSQMLESISIDRIFDAICGKARLCNSINHPPRMIIAHNETIDLLPSFDTVNKYKRLLYMCVCVSSLEFGRAIYACFNGTLWTIEFRNGTR